MAHDVFISHARSDKPIADAVCATLEQVGIRCWIAPRDIQPGTDWGRAIIQGLKGSRALVLVLSASANASAHITREVERAVHQGIPVIPLRVEDVVPEGALEYHLGTVHWLDAMTPPLEAHLRRLSETLQAILEIAPLPVAAPVAPVPLPRDLPAPEENVAEFMPQAAAEPPVERVSPDEPGLVDDPVLPRSFSSAVDVEGYGPSSILLVAWLLGSLADLLLMTASLNAPLEGVLPFIGATLLSAVAFGASANLARSDAVLALTFAVLDLAAIGILSALAGWPAQELVRILARDVSGVLGLLLAVRLFGIRAWPMMLMMAVARAAASYVTDVRAEWSRLSLPSNPMATTLAAFAGGLVLGAVIWKAIRERQSAALDQAAAAESESP